MIDESKAVADTIGAKPSFAVRRMYVELMAPWKDLFRNHDIRLKRIELSDIATEQKLADMLTRLLKLENKP